MSLAPADAAAGGAFAPRMRWRLWPACAVLTAAAHGLLAWLLLHHVEAPPADAALPPAVLIDLAPLPVAAPVPPSVAPPGPEQTLAQPSAEPIEPPMPIVPPSPTPSEVLVPTPAKPKPAPPKPVVKHQPPKKLPDTKRAAPDTSAPPPLDAPPAPAAAAPVPGAAAPSSNAIPNWQALISGRLERFKRYPRIAQLRRQQGVAYLRFTMDRNGRVLSATLEKSSGVAALDEEALALIRRAEPLPTPPAEIPGNTISLTVPIQFFLQ